MNKVGGGMIEPEVSFSLEETSLLTNPNLNKIDIRVVAKNPQEV